MMMPRIDDREYRSWLWQEFAKRLCVRPHTSYDSIAFLADQLVAMFEVRFRHEDSCPVVAGPPDETIRFRACNCRVSRYIPGQPFPDDHIAPVSQGPDRGQAPGGMKGQGQC